MDYSAVNENCMTATNSDVENVNSIDQTCQENEVCTSTPNKYNELCGNGFVLEDSNSCKCNDDGDNIVLRNERKCDVEIQKVLGCEEDILMQVATDNDIQSSSDYNNENMELDVGNSKQYQTNTKTDLLTSLHNPGAHNKDNKAVNPMEEVDYDLGEMEPAQNIINDGNQETTVGDHNNSNICVENHSQQQGHGIIDDKELILTPGDCNDNDTRLPELKQGTTPACRVEILEAFELTAETMEVTETDDRLNNDMMLCDHYKSTVNTSDMPITNTCNKIQCEMTSNEATFPEKKNIECFAEHNIIQDIISKPVVGNSTNESVVSDKDKQQLIKPHKHSQKIFASKDSSEELMRTDAEIQQYVSHGSQGLMITVAAHANHISLDADEIKDGSVNTSNTDEYKAVTDNMSSESTNNGLEFMVDCDYVLDSVNTSNNSEEPMAINSAKLEALSDYSNKCDLVCSSSIEIVVAGDCNKNPSQPSLAGDINTEPMTTSVNKQWNMITGRKHRKPSVMDRIEPVLMTMPSSNQGHLIAANCNQASTSNISKECVNETNNGELLANDGNDNGSLDLGNYEQKHFVNTRDINDNKVPDQNLPINVTEQRSGYTNKSAMIDTCNAEKLNAADEDSQRKVDDNNQDVMAAESNNQKSNPTEFYKKHEILTLESNNPELSRATTKNTANSDITQVLMMCGDKCNNQQLIQTVNDEQIPDINTQEYTATDNKEGECKTAINNKPESMAFDKNSAGKTDFDKGSDAIATNNNAQELSIIDNNEKEYRRVNDLNLDVMLTRSNPEETLPTYISNPGHVAVENKTVEFVTTGSAHQEDLPTGTEREGYEAADDGYEISLVINVFGSEKGLGNNSEKKTFYSDSYQNQKNHSGSGRISICAVDISEEQKAGNIINQGTVMINRADEEITSSMCANDTHRCNSENYKFKTRTSSKETMIMKDGTESNETQGSTKETVNFITSIYSKETTSIKDGIEDAMTTCAINRDCKPSEDKYLELNFCEQQHDEYINEEKKPATSDEKYEASNKENKKFLAFDDENSEESLGSPETVLHNTEHVPNNASKMVDEEKATTTSSRTVCKVHFGSPLVEYIEYTPASDEDDDDDTVILESEDPFWEDNKCVSDERKTDHAFGYFNDLQKTFSESSGHDILNVKPIGEKITFFKDVLFNNEEQEVPADLCEQIDFRQTVSEKKKSVHRNSSNHKNIAINIQPNNKDQFEVALKYSKHRTTETGSRIRKLESNWYSECNEDNMELINQNCREMVKYRCLKRNLSKAEQCPTKNLKLNTCDSGCCPSAGSEVTAAVVPVGEWSAESTCAHYDDDVLEDTLFYEQLGETSYKGRSTVPLKSNGNNYPGAKMAEECCKILDHTDTVVGMPNHKRTGSLRLGLSRKQRVASLHPYLKNK